MWRITLIANTLLMGVFSFACAFSMIPVYNNYVCYSVQKPLPYLTLLALDNLWIYKIVPLLAVVLLLFLLHRFRGKTMPVEYVQLHTSLILLAGVFMLTFFCIAGVLPFIPITVSLGSYHQ